MRRWLQEFSFKKSFYERPNQKWICGRACDGQGCLAGPDKHGNCTATAECRPLKKGDRWHCTRHAALGGPCASGPSAEGACGCPIPKCTPVMSLRAKRGVAVVFAVALSLAALFYVFGSEKGAKTVMPGELSFGHGSAQSKCSDCHSGAVGRPIAWLAENPHSASAHEDSKLCLNCHNLGDSPMYPHALRRDQLQGLTRAVLATSKPTPKTVKARLGDVVAGTHFSADQIACASCHKEHRGQQSDLKKLTNAQCQTCHSVTFASFSNGHPDFTGYPFERRTRIIFDHDSHLNQHFKDPNFAKSAPHLCLDCHQTDLKGGVMLVKPFDMTCASCHGEQIKGKGAVKPGIPFIALPRFDDRTLAGEYGIGEWPEDAEQGLTPFTQLILSADPDLKAAMETLKGADLSSLPKTDKAKLKAAQQLAWGIKGLIFDLETKGQTWLVDRIGQGLGHTLSAWDSESAVSMLGPEVVKAAFSPFFPHLQDEVLAYREKKKAAETELTPSPPLPKKGPVKVTPPEEWVEGGGWYAPDGAFAVMYRPTGHANRFFTSWMSLTVDPEHTAAPAAAAAIFSDMSAPKAAGYCAKCHSIDSSPTNMVNWHSAQLDPNEHKFNRFSHSSHLSLMDNRGCYTCHTLKKPGVDKTPVYASAFEKNQRDPSVFHSNFEVISKQACAECHKPTFVRDDCLLCHNYHIGEFRTIPKHSEVGPVASIEATGNGKPK